MALEEAKEARKAQVKLELEKSLLDKELHLQVCDISIHPLPLLATHSFPIQDKLGVVELAAWEREQRQQATDQMGQMEAEAKVSAERLLEREVGSASLCYVGLKHQFACFYYDAGCRSANA